MCHKEELAYTQRGRLCSQYFRQGHISPKPGSAMCPKLGATDSRMRQTQAFSRGVPCCRLVGRQKGH